MENSIEDRIVAGAGESRNSGIAVSLEPNMMAQTFARKLAHFNQIR
jgi:hypothetical protein